MNERIKHLATLAKLKDGELCSDISIERFAELVVEECRVVMATVYQRTPLEICGPLLTADEEIAQHFYGEIL
jgi:hypothetical protein